MTLLQFQKELCYISEGIVLKNSQKDLRRCEGFKVLYSASNCCCPTFHALIQIRVLSDFYKVIDQ